MACRVLGWRPFKFDIFALGVSASRATHLDVPARTHTSTSTASFVSLPCQCARHFLSPHRILQYLLQYFPQDGSFHRSDLVADGHQVHGLIEGMLALVELKTPAQLDSNQANCIAEAQAEAVVMNHLSPLPRAAGA